MPFNQGHALLIGVGTHQYHPALNVPITVQDAQAIAEVLQDPEACGYLPPQVKLLHDRETTRQGILTALDELCQVGQEDTVFLFYCGHGGLGTDGNYYLVSHDARVDGGRIVAGSGVSEAELLAKLRAIPARRMLLIFNACHSGNISPSLDVATETLVAQNPSEDSAAALLGTGEGRIIIAACRENQKSWIGSGKNSIFTQALVDGLRGKGVPNRSGYISAFGLYEHVYETVSEYVQENLHTTQEPELTVVKGVGPFAVSLYRGATTLGALDDQEAPPANTAVREISQKKSQKTFNQVMTSHQQGGINIGGQAQVHVNGDMVGRDKIVKDDKK